MEVVPEVSDFMKVLGSAAVDLLPATLGRPRPCSCFPFSCLPLRCLPFRSLAFGSLPLACGAWTCGAFFLLALAASFSAASLSAFFSAFFCAFFSSLAFRRNRSALASARFFLRFFSQAAHLQPIGFRYALK